MQSKCLNDKKKGILQAETEVGRARYGFVNFEIIIHAGKDWNS